MTTSNGQQAVGGPFASFPFLPFARLVRKKAVGLTGWQMVSIHSFIRLSLCFVSLVWLGSVFGVELNGTSKRISFHFLSRKCILFISHSPLHVHEQASAFHFESRDIDPIVLVAMDGSSGWSTIET